MAPPAKQQKVGKDSEESDTPSNNLWVGNLSGETVDSDLMELFNKYGALDSVTTYSSRSYAFVYFKRVEDAKAAKEALQGTTLHGNQIKIEFARPVRFIVLIFSVSSGFSKFSQFLCNYMRLCFEGNRGVIDVLHLPVPNSNPQYIYFFNILRLPLT